MCSVPTEVAAAERARWLAELSEALDEAHELVIAMHSRRPDLSELYVRIEAARLEVQSLRLSRSLNPRQMIHPDRIEFAPWQRDVERLD